MSILTVQHLEKHFENTKVLNDISFSLEEGQALSIIGSSGSGKTTLLRCLNFLETPDAGTITVQDKVLFDADHHANCSEKAVLRISPVWITSPSTFFPSIRLWKT